MESKETKIRLDKWLWAARFYKTRSIARSMIEGGKVEYNGVRAKPSRTVEISAKVRFLQGNVRREVIIEEISDIRGPASEAQKLYRETDESLLFKEKQLKQLKINALLAPHPDAKPNKKERRALLGIKHNL